MKKIILAAGLAASLLTTQAMADKDMYVGLDIVSSSNEFTLDNSLVSVSGDDNSEALKFKVGSTGNDGWRYQFYYLRETYDMPVFDASNDVLIEIGYDIIKGFKVTPKFSSFIQAGVGFGWMNVTGYTESSWKEYSLKIGAGVMYELVSQVELVAGIDLQHRQWQDINVGFYTIDTTEKSTKLYAGINYYF